jgi:hypothetical protein
VPEVCGLGGDPVSGRASGARHAGFHLGYLAAHLGAHVNLGGGRFDRVAKLLSRPLDIFGERLRVTGNDLPGHRSRTWLAGPGPCRCRLLALVIRGPVWRHRRALSLISSTSALTLSAVCCGTGGAAC